MIGCWPDLHRLRRGLVGMLCLSVLPLIAAPLPARADDTPSVKIGYLRWTDRQPVISLIEKPAPDNGLAGAKLALADDNTTGRLVGQQFELVDSKLRPDDDATAALSALVGQGVKLVITDAPGATVLKLADAGKAQGVAVFNLAAPDDNLREQDCQANMIHIGPTRSMLADAVAQYLVWKKWTRWLLVVGPNPDDVAPGDAYRRAAKRFGARIVDSRTYNAPAGSRETDTGLLQMQQQMPVFTQNAPQYDVLVAADESQAFGEDLPYRTWDARPVAGSGGLEPVVWSPSSESWGGAQLQSRFTRMAHRFMTGLDMEAWTAVRMVGDAATRSKSTDPATIMSYMEGPDFRIAAYKGQELTLRNWNWQLRQPIFLSDGRTVVSISPQPGFLHQLTELDTLGVDKPETQCKLH
jgi:ABC transporter substrate binding protein (PQQ-dependent alcohol dehydrogenase system)